MQVLQNQFLFVSIFLSTIDLKKTKPKYGLPYGFWSFESSVFRVIRLFEFRPFEIRPFKIWPIEIQPFVGDPNF